MLELLRTDPKLLRALPGCRPLGVGGGRLAYKPNRSQKTRTNLLISYFLIHIVIKEMRKKYTICISSAFFNILDFFLIHKWFFFYKWSRKSSDLWEVHVDSFSDIWMLLDDVSDLLHDLSVELSKFTDIKIFL